MGTKHSQHFPNLQIATSLAAQHVVPCAYQMRCCACASHFLPINFHRNIKSTVILLVDFLRCCLSPLVTVAGWLKGAHIPNFSFQLSSSSVRSSSTTDCGRWQRQSERKAKIMKFSQLKCYPWGAGRTTAGMKLFSSVSKAGSCAGAQGHTLQVMVHGREDTHSRKCLKLAFFGLLWSRSQSDFLLDMFSQWGEAGTWF